MSISQTAFTKYEGLGNDFILIQDREDLTADQSSTLCDRRHGVGGDGVLLVFHRNGRPYMRVLNSDGSEPEMCGNGIRCVALHLLRTQSLETIDIEIDTKSGPHRCIAQATANKDEATVEVFMQTATLASKDVPALVNEPLLDHPVHVLGQQVRLTAVSMGNPHIVTFDAIDQDLQKTLGSALQTHALFPHGVNVSFATLIDSQTIQLAVLERGAGWTLACGTGACATVVAAVETNRIARGSEVRVDLPGGRLFIQVGERHEPVHMRGPARHVFDGQITV
jgi:diaminopimelate epimerase